MPKTFFKHKILFDENMSDRSYFPMLNQHFDVKHIKIDLHKEGLSDPLVYAFAVMQKRIIVTFNWSDFLDLVGADEDAGVIGIGGSDWHRIDTKLTALLIKQKPSYFNGKLRTLGKEQKKKEVH